MIKPYYSDARVTLYNEDCLDVLPLVPPAIVSLLLTDPPYGVSERTDRGSKGRGIATNSGSLAEASDFPPVYGDDKPFDPTPLLVYPRCVLFGANYYAHRLPVSPSWLVWDKLNGLSGKRTVGFNDNADCEMAWSNLGGPARIFRHRWMGAMKESEHGQRRVHPTQKPVVLMQRIIEWRAPGGRIFDPYAGSGSTILGGLLAGCKVVACEIEQHYCDVIVSRLRAFYADGLSADERTAPLPKMRKP